MDITDSRKKFDSAARILDGQSTTFEKFESIRTLTGGFNPKVDRALESCSKALSTLKKLQEGEIIELTAENLPENTEDEKKRKRALLWFIRSQKQLQGEVERVKAEFEHSGHEPEDKSIAKQVDNFGKIFTFAKGPFGIITLLALVIAGALVFWGRSRQTGAPMVIPTPATVSTPVGVSSPSPILTMSPTPSGKAKVKVITFIDKKIPLSELEVRTGPDCTDSPREAPHYHAKNNVSVVALDGSVIHDPGACAFGKVSEVMIEEIETPQI